MYKKMTMQNYEVDTLFYMSLRKVVCHIDVWYKMVKDLPNLVKDEILQRVMLYRKLNSENLLYLVHPMVTSLDLSHCERNEMPVTVKLCRQFEDLCLVANSCAPCTRLDSAVLVSAFTTLHKLRSLSLAKLQSVTDDVIESVTSNCPLLTLLDVGGCNRISNASLEALENLKLLNILKISHTEVTDQGMVPYLEKCGSQLTELHLYGCNRLTVETSKAVSTCCKNLRYFSSELDFTSAEVQAAVGEQSAVKNLEYYAWNIS